MPVPTDSGDARRFLEEHPDTRTIELLIPDLNGVLRGKRIERDALSRLYRDGIGLPGSLFGADISGATAEVTVHPGYPVTANDPDLTARMLPVLRRVAGGEGRSYGAGPLERVRGRELPSHRAFDRRYDPSRHADWILAAANPLGA